MPNMKRNARNARQRALTGALAHYVTGAPTVRESAQDVAPDSARKVKVSRPRGVPQSRWERVAVVNSCGCAQRVHVGPCDRRGA